MRFVMGFCCCCCLPFVLPSARESFAHLAVSPLLVTAGKMMLARSAFEQWGIFIVSHLMSHLMSHLLWHGTSVFAVSPERPDQFIRLLRQARGYLMRTNSTSSTNVRPRSRLEYMVDSKARLTGRRRLRIHQGNFIRIQFFFSQI